MLTLGIDPDMHCLGWAVVKDADTILQVGTVKSKGGVTDMFKAIDAWEPPCFDRIVVESQELRYHHPRPDDIVKLGHVAAYCLARLTPNLECGMLHFPLPSEWKGQKPKHVMQGRLYTQLKMPYETVGAGKGSYCRPLNPPEWWGKIKPADWKHVGDAILLALWGASC